MEDPSPDDAGQKTVRRSRRAGRDEGGSRTLRRSAGGCTKRLGAAGTRGTMWKTATASGRTTPASRRPHPQRTPLHKDRKGGDLFLFTHLTGTAPAGARPPPLHLGLGGLDRATPRPAAAPCTRYCVCAAMRCIARPSLAWCVHLLLTYSNECERARSGFTRSLLLVSRWAGSRPRRGYRTRLPGK